MYPNYQGGYAYGGQPYVPPQPQPNPYLDRINQLQASLHAPKPGAPAQNVEWVQVNGYEGAKAQTVQPGCVCWMRDNADPYIYAKSVDMMGTPTIEAFRVERVDPTTMRAQAAAPAEAGIPAEEYKALMDRVAALEKEIREAKARGAITASKKGAGGE